MPKVNAAENKYQWQAEMDVTQDYAYAQSQLRETQDFLYESYRTMPTNSRQHKDFAEVLTHINEALSYVTFKNRVSIKEWQDWSNRLTQQQMALEESYPEDELPFQSIVWMNMVDDMCNVAGRISTR